MLDSWAVWLLTGPCRLSYCSVRSVFLIPSFTMETQEHSKQLWEKVIKRYTRGIYIYKKNQNHWSSCGILRKPSLRNGMNVAHSQSILTQWVTKREEDCWERPPRHIWQQSSNSVLVASESLYQSKLFSGEEKRNPLLNAHKRDSKGQMREGLARPNGSIFFPSGWTHAVSTKHITSVQIYNFTWWRQRGAVRMILSRKLAKAEDQIDVAQIQRNPWGQSVSPWMRRIYHIKTKTWSIQYNVDTKVNVLERLFIPDPCAWQILRHRLSAVTVY